MKTHFKVIAINETNMWDPSIAERSGGKIFGLYLIDAERKVCACEITPSYEAIPIGDYPQSSPENEAERDRLDDDIRQGSIDCGYDVKYFHCHQIDALMASGSVRVMKDFEVDELDENVTTYEEALSSMEEYCRSNLGELEMPEQIDAIVVTSGM